MSYGGDSSPRQARRHSEMPTPYASLRVGVFSPQPYNTDDEISGVITQVIDSGETTVSIAFMQKNDRLFFELRMTDIDFENGFIEQVGRRLNLNCPIEETTFKYLSL